MVVPEGAATVEAEVMEAEAAAEGAAVGAGIERGFRIHFSSGIWCFRLGLR